jgi:hypothetical protein
LIFPQNKVNIRKVPQTSADIDLSYTSDKSVVKTKIFMSNFDVDSYLTIEEVQSIFACSQGAIYAKVRSGRFHPVKGIQTGMKKNYKRLLFNPLEIDEEIKRIEELRKLRRGYAGTMPFRQELSKPSMSHVRKRNETPEVPGATRRTSGKEEHDGELCARAVSLFLEGKTPLDVVQLMSINFKTAKYFWDSFREVQAESERIVMAREHKNKLPVVEKETPLTPEELAALNANDDEED